MWRRVQWGGKDEKSGVEVRHDRSTLMQVWSSHKERIRQFTSQSQLFKWSNLRHNLWIIPRSQCRECIGWSYKRRFLVASVLLAVLLHCGFARLFFFFSCSFFFFFKFFWVSRNSGQSIDDFSLHYFQRSICWTGRHGVIL